MSTLLYMFSLLSTFNYLCLTLPRFSHFSELKKASKRMSCSKRYKIQKKVSGYTAPAIVWQTRPLSMRYLPYYSFFCSQTWYDLNVTYGLFRSANTTGSSEKRRRRRGSVNTWRRTPACPVVRPSRKKFSGRPSRGGCRWVGIHSMAHSQTNSSEHKTFLQKCKLESDLKTYWHVSFAHHTWLYGNSGPFLAVVSLHHCICIDMWSFLILNVSSPQIEEEKQKKREAVKEARAQKRKKEKVAASEEAEPGAKKARQVKVKKQSVNVMLDPFSVDRLLLYLLPGFHRMTSKNRKENSLPLTRALRSISAVN